MVDLFTNSGDPDQLPYSVASDLGLHSLPVTFLGVSRLQWVKALITTTADNTLRFFFVVCFLRK